MKFTNLLDYQKWIDDFNTSREAPSGVEQYLLHGQQDYKVIQKDVNTTQDINTVPSINTEFTIVTLVHGIDYLDRFKQCFRKYLTKDIFANNKLLIYYLDDSILDELKEITSQHFNVVFVKHSYEAETVREQCLSAFILGVDNIETDYYIKWDADTYGNPYYHYPSIEDYCNYDIVAPSCQLTKGMVDGYNMLSYLDMKTFNVFENHSQNNRTSNNDHKNKLTGKLFTRHQSYFAIYSTEFVKEVKDYLVKNNNGKMIIPSEDTTLSYFAHVWDKKVKYISKTHTPNKVHR